jgi:hypothetical protein
MKNLKLIILHKILCLIGRHYPVYMLKGLDRYEVKCFYCSKLLDEGVEQ